MQYDDLRGQRVEDLLNRVQGLAAAAAKDEIQSIMAVVARCTLEVSDTLVQLSGDIQQAQKILSTRLSELNTELQKTREVMATASDVASKQTAALVRWRKILVFVTAAYTVIAGRMLLVTLFGSPWSR